MSVRLISSCVRLPVWLAAACALVAGAGAAGEPVVSDAVMKRHVAKFNAMEPEGVVNVVPNAAAADWLAANVPRFECADPAVEEIYWFRWWALRKQLRKDAASGRFVFGEFINKDRPVSSALGHHLMEGRWLRDQKFHDDYVLYWFRGKGGRPQEHFHRFSQWVDWSLWSRWLVTQDTATLTGLLDDLVADYKAWEMSNGRPDGLFWNYDVRDAMEESISGGRKVKNVRPTISCYMYGNATALAAIARLAGREELAKEFDAKATQLRALVQAKLWNPELKFFGSCTEELVPIPVREEIGFIPWYFDLPEAGHGYGEAWKQLTDEQGFKAPWGITTAERRAPGFRTHGTGHSCEWDGAVWPFATSQTLTALSNVLHDYPQQKTMTNRDWFDAFMTYTRSHVYDGLPYIGEYQDEKTGAWLKGRDPRSYYYNHSTYADLLITGLVGLRPRADNVVDVAPLLPAGTWDWFALDGVRYHGRDLTLLWDKDGKHYGRGAGLQIIVDGQTLARSERLEPLTAKLP